MSIPQAFTLLLTAKVALLLTSLGVSAQQAEQQTNWPVSAAVQTESGQNIPAGAYGVAYIDAPRVATLLQLRGVTGSGIVILKSDDSHECLTVPIRFVAGDFGGEGIFANATSPIRSIFQSARVAERFGDHTAVLALFRHDIEAAVWTRAGDLPPTTAQGSSLHHIALSLPSEEQEPVVAWYEKLSLRYHFETFDCVGWLGVFTCDLDGKTVGLFAKDPEWLAPSSPASKVASRRSATNCWARSGLAGSVIALAATVNTLESDPARANPEIL